MNKYRELLFLKELNGVGTVRINKFYLPFLSGGSDLDALAAIAKESEKKVDDANIERALKVSEMLFESHSKAEGTRIVTALDEDYPSKLRSLGNNAPAVLYVKGDLSVAEKASLSVVGTRNPSGWSGDVEKQLIGKVIEFSDRVIISGLAAGCDTIAHRECIKQGGLTIAVLPCGFDHIFPSENTGLCDEIVESGGALISAYPPETEASQYTYVERDTLIAAISDAVFVMECGIKSGTMHTVDSGIGLERRIAAFSTLLKDKGNYEGNDFIINEKGGYAVSDNESLKAFLNDVGSVVIEEQPVQMTLFDFAGK